MSSKVASISLEIAKRAQLLATLAMTALGFLLPFAIHFFPTFQGTPVGAMFIPMFYMPFIASLFFRFHVGFIAAALAPVLNYAITGHPTINLVTILTIEMSAFVVVAFFLNHHKLFRYISAPLSYLIVKVFSLLLLTIIPSLISIAPIDFFINSISTAVPGIVILTLLNLILIKFKK